MRGFRGCLIHNTTRRIQQGCHRGCGGSGASGAVEPLVQLLRTRDAEGKARVASALLSNLAENSDKGSKREQEQHAYTNANEASKRPQPPPN
eukprot:1194187-Prorocentrum_minimum.AAC.1